MHLRSGVRTLRKGTISKFDDIFSMEKTKKQPCHDTLFKTPEPPQFDVVMFNDDVTTMDFVIMVLIRIFRYSQEVAERLMLQIHTEGSAIVGTYYFDIAQSKAEYAMSLARTQGFPLQLKVEEAS